MVFAHTPCDMCDVCDSSPEMLLAERGVSQLSQLSQGACRHDQVPGGGKVAAVALQAHESDTSDSIPLVAANPGFACRKTVLDGFVAENENRRE